MVVMWRLFLMFVIDKTFLLPPSFSSLAYVASPYFVASLVLARVRCFDWLMKREKARSLPRGTLARIDDFVVTAGYNFQIEVLRIE